MPINSRAKGVRGEHQVRDLFRRFGFSARRGQQFQGTKDSPDVIVEDLTLLVESKFTEMTEVYTWMNKLTKEAAGSRRIPAVFHRKNRGKMLVSLDAEDFLFILTNSSLSGSDTVDMAEDRGFEHTGHE